MNNIKITAQLMHVSQCLTLSSNLCLMKFISNLLIVAASLFSFSCNGSANHNAGITTVASKQSVSAGEITITDSKRIEQAYLDLFHFRYFYVKGLASYDVTQPEYVNKVRNLHPYAVAFSGKENQ